MALYGFESQENKRYLEDKSLAIVKAMNTSRQKMRILVIRYSNAEWPSKESER